MKSATSEGMVLIFRTEQHSTIPPARRPGSRPVYRDGVQRQTGHRRQKLGEASFDTSQFQVWSGKRGSNSRPRTLAKVALYQLSSRKIKLEARTGIEPMYLALQAAA